MYAICQLGLDQIEGGLKRRTISMAPRLASPLGDVSFAVNTSRQTLAQTFNPSTYLFKLR